MEQEDLETSSAYTSQIHTTRKVYAREGFDCPTCGAPAPRACRTASGIRAENWHAARYRLAATTEGWQ